MALTRNDKEQLLAEYEQGPGQARRTPSCSATRGSPSRR